MPYTEFYCNASTGNNLYSGSTPGTPDQYYINGSWVASTGVYTCNAIYDPVADGVAVGDFAAINANSATVGVFVGMVTGFTTTTVTISLTVKAGTPPADTPSFMNCVIGGAWKGPNAQEDFPFGFVTSALNDGTNKTPRINFKNAGSYLVTNAINHSPADDGPVIWSGYFTTPGDGGYAEILGPGTGNGFTVLSFGGTTCRRQRIENFRFVNNGATVSATGVTLGSVNGGARNIYVANMRGIGISLAGAGATYVEIEAYNCNVSNTADLPGIQVQTSCRAIRCIARANLKHGFGSGTAASQSPTLSHCISAGNGASGFSFRAPAGTGGGTLTMLHCDSYDNADDGLRLDAITLGGTVFCESCNFVANGGWGVQQVDALFQHVVVRNCGFGSGTQANALGNFNVPSSTGTLSEEGSVHYPADMLPWRDPVATGAGANDFTIVLDPVKGAGAGTFPGISNTGAVTNVGYPDIGAVQSLPRRPRAQYVLGI